MAGRRLDTDELALWRRVVATVRPIGRQAQPLSPDPPRATVGPSVSIRPRAPVVPSKPPGETLDGGWDRRLAKGTTTPDRTLDLHGHTLASAHAALDHGLERALTDGVRLLLLVTGRPPRADDRDGRPRRGAIRAAVPDWLAGSRHAARIAAIRNAHPRHGGAGALYIILRRPR